MAYKFREEIVGKRFLSVSGFTKLKVNKISEWGWRAGVIRAASHRDNGCHDLQYLTPLKSQRPQTPLGIWGHHCRPGGFPFSGFSVSKNAIALLGSRQTYRRTWPIRTSGSLPERDFSYKSFHCFNAAFAAHLPRLRRSTVILGTRNIQSASRKMVQGNAVTQDGWKVHWPVKNLGEGESVG
ncbi:hypothetical protein G5I_01975 [Acromyrmex echinatior]|uniref:DUF7030 domain-containing protein n=1 Tax=Acromyrmex echinatior TaxID=103372 RepID=F4W929_ACREC|nr:hypothetical protein G5I_01975 [Acromyrmex echinatior]